MNDDELKAISERMGEIGHNAWMEKRRKEKGWHAPEDCPGPEECYACKGTGRCTTTLIPSGVEIHECGLCDGKGTVPCQKCHPCMRPYKDLPDSEKELQRLYPKLFLQALDEMGYEVIRKGTGVLTVPTSHPGYGKGVVLKGPSDIQE